MKPVGFVGPAGAGKDFSVYMLRDLGIPIVKFSFSDNIKYDIENHLSGDMFVEYGDGEKYVPGMVRLPELWNKPYSNEIRSLLQWWGTDLRREQDPKYWLRMMGEQIHQWLFDPETYPAISDVRFQNEADMLRDWGGILVRIQAPVVVRAKRLAMEPETVLNMSMHPSEAEGELIEADFTITSVSEKGWKKNAKDLIKELRLPLG